MSGFFGSSVTGTHLIVAYRSRCFLYYFCISSHHTNVQKMLMIEICVHVSIVINTAENILMSVFAYVSPDYRARSEILRS